MKRLFVLLLATMCGALAAAPATNAPNMLIIPLDVLHNARYGVYKATISIGFGNLPVVPMGFDTGSIGLHVFKAAHLERRDGGVHCNRSQAISFTVGNPGKIVYSGYMCSAPIRFANYTSSISIPIAYLTSDECAKGNQGCKLPSMTNPAAHGGVYGVFGAGITGAMPVENPILALPSPYNSTYSIHLTHDRGELILGGGPALGAVPFPLATSTAPGVAWAPGQTCLFVNNSPTSLCLNVSFDTGNGVPWIRDSNNTPIPQSSGLVEAGTQIGFGPPGATKQATSVRAGSSFYDKIKVEGTTGTPLTNTGIAAFFDHVLTYDNARGVIYVAPDAGVP